MSSSCRTLTGILQPQLVAQTASLLQQLREAGVLCGVCQPWRQQHALKA